LLNGVGKFASPPLEKSHDERRHHPSWNDKEINTLKKIKGRDLEVVRMKEIVTG
jgi:hypothetical protein